MKLFSSFRAAVTSILVIAALPGTLVAASAAEVVVFAAASLKEALDDAVGIYDNQSDDTVKISYAASPTLAKQIESGARPTSSSRPTSTGWITFNNTISFSPERARAYSETGWSSSLPPTAI